MTVFLLILSVIVTLVIYNILKVFVFDKVHINKWLILVVAILFLFLPAVLGLPQNGYMIDLYMPFTVIPLLWFFNLMFFTKKDEKSIKRIKIKPKAKPNRIKNIHK